MVFTIEDLPKVVEQVKVAITDNGLNLDDFDISINESKVKVRVETHDIDKGGFIINLFTSGDFDRLVQEDLVEWSKK